jgi:hypothetical protein
LSYVSSFALVGVGRFARNGRRGHRIRRTILLNHVGQLVREKTSTFASAWLIPVCAEDDIPPDSEGERVNRRSGFGGHGIGVYPNLRKPMTKSGLHDRPRSCVERSAR